MKMLPPIAETKPYDSAKFKSMLKFFIGVMPGVGLTKLCALCYFADFDHYERYGVSISGSVYTKAKNGAIPETIGRSLRELYEAGEIVAGTTLKDGKHHQFTFYLKEDYHPDIPMSLL